VQKALRFLTEHGITGEVVVADNGSTDGSQALAIAAGARVVAVPDRGYGNALQAGIRAAHGRFVVMGDADDSYDFSALDPFLHELRAGADLVVGNRFRGGIAPGAMPALHRYLGNPVLSWIGRVFFDSPVRDFHCGLRAFRRDQILALDLQSAGMEFASEMIVRSTLAELRIVEVPTTLAKDGRSRPPHLRSWHDGWRHLRFLLLYSPRWLFLIPGLVLMALGIVVGVPLAIRPVTVGSVTFDVDTLVGCSAAVIIGFQAVLFAVLTKVFAIQEGFLPADPRIRRLLRLVSVERGLLVGGSLAMLGMVGVAISLVHWDVNNYGQLNPRQSLRLMIPSATALIASGQAILASLFVSILGIRTSRLPAPTLVTGPDAAALDASLPVASRH
jgi:hypothetical protein